MKDLSLTARISVLFALAASLVLLGAGLLLARAVEGHFLEQDRREIDGKLELIGHLLGRARAPMDWRVLPRQLEDALLGHHALAVTVLGPASEHIYSHGHDIPVFPPGLLRRASRGEAALAIWPEGGRFYRGLAKRLPTGLPGQTATVAIALEVTHHRMFMAEFRELLALAMALAALATAALGWAVARSGLRPLRRVTATAAGISASRLTERLHETHVPAELRELVAAFNAMLQRLEESFRRLSDFSSDIAHELRTPVSNLMTQTQVALGQARGAEEYREILHSNLEEYERLARMIGDMLFLAKADNQLLVPQRESLDLAEEARRLLEFHEAMAEEAGVRLELEGTARVAGDRLMLQRAIANLLSNAIRHTAPGGSVHLALAREAEWATLQLINPGPAIPPEHLPRLFDRFYRVDPARREGDAEHTGLGLAICKSIVEAHGGNLTVSSQPGETRFTLRLPA